MASTPDPSSRGSTPSPDPEQVQKIVNLARQILPPLAIYRPKPLFSHPDFFQNTPDGLSIQDTNHPPPAQKRRGELCDLNPKKRPREAEIRLCNTLPRKYCKVETHKN
jgi:hypothetical protein